MTAYIKIAPMCKSGKRKARKLVIKLMFEKEWKEGIE